MLAALNHLGKQNTHWKCWVPFVLRSCGLILVDKMWKHGMFAPSGLCWSCYGGHGQDLSLLDDVDHVRGDDAGKPVTNCHCSSALVKWLWSTNICMFKSSFVEIQIKIKSNIQWMQKGPDFETLSRSGPMSKKSPEKGPICLSSPEVY